MKIFYTLLFLVFLASCGTSTPGSSQDTTANEHVSVPTPVAEEIADEEILEEMAGEIEEETMALDDTVENELITLDAGYSNPKGPVDMQISYNVDDAGIIQSIDVSATTYDLTDFNSAAQVLVGQTLQDAESFYVAGGSLTSDAFTSALKNR